MRKTWGGAVGDGEEAEEGCEVGGGETMLEAERTMTTARALICRKEKKRWRGEWATAAGWWYSASSSSSFSSRMSSPPMEMEEREKVVRHMWDIYAHSLRIRLPRFWREVFEVTYEELASNDLAIQDAAISEIARMSMRMVDLEPPPCHPKNAELHDFKRDGSSRPKVIADNLSEEEIGGLKELFKMIDTDNSGTIAFDELKDGLKRVGSDLMESEIQALLDAADIDKSGTIDYGEFLAATVHMNKLEREENLISAFSFFDKDGSGYITIDELSQACREFGLDDVHLDEMIKEIDQDNDGQIDYGEFAAMMRKGNGGIGRTMRNSLNISLGVVLKTAEH